MKNLKNSLKNVYEHNAKAAKGEKSYTIAINQFSDMDIDEIINSFTGYKPSDVINNVVNNIKSPPKNSTSWKFDTYRSAPTKVTPIRNQVSFCKFKFKILPS